MVSHSSHCVFPKKPYLCNVFFIVLDLRLTKVGLSGALFYVLKSNATGSIGSTFRTQSVLLRRHLLQTLEKTPEIRLVGKTEADADFLYA